MKSKYRYYSDSLSRNAVSSLNRHLPKIGTPLEVKGLSEGKNGGWYELVVLGTAGKLVLRGCSWGYHGEGSRATAEVLKALGVHPFDVQQVAFGAPNKEVGTVAGLHREFWRLTLPASTAQLAAGNFFSNLTHAQAVSNVLALKGGAK